MAPDVGRSNPASSRMSVLFPHPEGPIITVSLPSSIVNEQSRITVFANLAVPYEFVTLSNSGSALEPVPVRSMAPPAPLKGPRMGASVTRALPLDISLVAQLGGHHLSHFGRPR